MKPRYIGLLAALACLAPASAEPLAGPAPGEDYETWERALRDRLDGAIDSLLAAARDGDEARVADLVVTGEDGFGPSFSDDGVDRDHRGLLTAARMQPVARDCRRAPAQPEFILTIAPTHTVNLLCGEAPYTLFAIFDEAGERIESITLYAVSGEDRP